MCFDLIPTFWWELKEIENSFRYNNSTQITPTTNLPTKIFVTFEFKSGVWFFPVLSLSFPRNCGVQGSGALHKSLLENWVEADFLGLAQKWIEKSPVAHWVRFVSLEHFRTLGDRFSRVSRKKIRERTTNEDSKYNYLNRDSENAASKNQKSCKNRTPTIKK